MLFQYSLESISSINCTAVQRRKIMFMEIGNAIHEVMSFFIVTGFLGLLICGLIAGGVKLGDYLG